MDQAAKAKFILALHKHSLQAFDSGGGVWNALSGQTNFQAQGPDYTSTANQATGNAFAEQGQQQQLATTLQNQANGQGPNPAQSQFQQNVSQIGQQQAGAIASQKGISPALAIRTAAGQGAQAQQAAAGQAATMQAQQQLQAQSQLQNQQAQIATENQNLYGTSTTGQSNENTTNAAVAQSNATNQGNALSGIISGAASALPFLANGGEVPSYPSALLADGGGPADAPTAGAIPAFQAFAKSFAANRQPQKQQQAQSQSGSTKAPGPVSSVAKWLKAGPAKAQDDPSLPMPPQNVAGPVAQAQAKPGMLPMPETVGMARGGKVGPRLDANGGKVSAQNPKQKATVKDNAYANDKVPTLLSEGEIVIPRSITMHPMAPEMAAKFVAAAINKRKMGRAA